MAGSGVLEARSGGRLRLSAGGADGFAAAFGLTAFNVNSSSQTQTLVPSQAQ